MGGWWIYWVGPFLGTLAALGLQRAPWARPLEIRVAKVFHFHHDPSGVFAHTAAKAERERRLGVR